LWLNDITDSQILVNQNNTYKIKKFFGLFEVFNKGLEKDGYIFDPFSFFSLI